MGRRVPLGTVVLAAAALLAVGCGGGSSSSQSSSVASPNIPLPKQKLSAFISRFERVAARRDCAGFRRFGATDSCARSKRVYGGAKAKDSATFETGAVVDLDNGWTLLLVEDTHRRWTIREGLDLKHPTAGTTTADQDGAIKSGEATFAAIVNRDCEAFYKYADTPGIPPSQKQKVCTPAFADLGPIYSQNKDAKPVPLGGTHDVQFLGYFLKAGTSRYYATVPVIFDMTATTNPWLALGPTPVLLKK